MELSGDNESENLGTGPQLLADIRRVFHEAGEDRLRSQDVCDRLADMEGAPWPEWGKNRKPISKNQLAIKLAEFGIKSRNVRIGEDVAKGYLLEDFTDAFHRYLSEDGNPKRYNATTPAEPGENTVS